ncbi:hypothetical protein AKG60_09165 [Vibrio parahaemolyticus]|uniref:Uncharacterized protein n=1 Tax=Vibrio parahaemolyticus TaxID=670 RepID=A0AAX0MEK2_VIBPH|nr:hypothetical protein [Vibrio parahaemolyticus]EGQ8301833.1 hypothetical protein [Vibrio parahaemolyticus]EGR2217311.1 hypothetical protein [Vibrio parahaemolyticus]EJG0023710.1 hypothetical protein [Vibrio parahaemolyticus]EJG0525847.1 hypothetical protein [Vibrio parahaemolyticus]MBE4204975.1 hypothetical protein [Vibrio parahaemolyticus]
MKLETGSSLTVITFNVPDSRCNYKMKSPKLTVTKYEVTKGGVTQVTIKPVDVDDEKSLKVKNVKISDFGKICNTATLMTRQIVFVEHTDLEHYINVAKEYQQNAIKERINELKSELTNLELLVKN